WRTQTTSGKLTRHQGTQPGICGTTRDNVADRVALQISRKIAKKQAKRIFPISVHGAPKSRQASSPDVRAHNQAYVARRATMWQTGSHCKLPIQSHPKRTFQPYATHFCSWRTQTTSGKLTRHQGTQPDIFGTACEQTG